MTENGTRIDSQDTLKTVGFTFGRRPGAAEHVRALRRKFAMRSGIIRHLKKIGTDLGTLVEVYRCFLRPLLEYACSSFHTTLTLEQSGMLERLQRMSLKVIFCFKVSYKDCLAKSGLERLDCRREAIFGKFAWKCYESDRFGPLWFTAKEKTCYSLRKNLEVVQEFAHRDRR